tara:strand:- start:63 stop:398 length:336 start_codon:yes stop_codon:yes gene_type:complete
MHEDDTKDDMYRLQFLQAFKLDNWDDDKIEKQTKDLYDCICKKDNLSDIYKKIKACDKYSFILNLLDNDDYSAFKILFMYDLFDLAHKYFCDILNTGIINIDNKNMLLNNI